MKQALIYKNMWSVIEGSPSPSFGRKPSKWTVGRDAIQGSSMDSAVDGRCDCVQTESNIIFRV